jgi:diguanylate cyclase (GGDEF)-like protein
MPSALPECVVAKILSTLHGRPGTAGELLPSYAFPVRPQFAALIAVVGILLAGWVDFATGIEMRVYPLYFAPLSVAAWFAPRLATAAIALFAAIVWGCSNFAAGLNFTHAWIWAWNLAAQACAFLTVGLLIGRLRARSERERELARVDPLTGLANRRGFVEAAPLLLAECQRHDRLAALAFLDLDDFKQVNDLLGHKMGDQVLAAIGGTLRREVRACDLAARLGGDEFVLFLPDTAPHGVGAVLSRMRAALQAELSAGGWHVGVSVGVAFSRRGESLEQFMARADALMLDVKRAGKGVVLLDPAIESRKQASP